jgi:hypothetical protein
MPDERAEILKRSIRTYQVKSGHVKGIEALKDL